MQHDRYSRFVKICVDSTSVVSCASLTSMIESESGRLRHTSIPPARILAEPMKTEY